MPTVTLKNTPSGIPSRIEVADDPKVGGEGRVYFSADGKYAIKIYHNPSADKEDLLRRIMTLFESLPADQSNFIKPPLALIDKIENDQRIGFIMNRVDPNYRELSDFMLNPITAVDQFKKNMTWVHYLKTARSVANAIVTLHGKGCAHTDIHFRNFLADLDSGSAVMLEIDGIVVQGYLPAQVKGMMGFMAPEILTQNADPSKLTVRHSLAVLILQTLLFRNVMKPLIEYDSDLDRSEKLGWGEKALFSENKINKAHRPKSLGKPLFKRGSLSYRILPPNLQKLADRALIDGIHDPDQRPSSREWANALAFAIDEIWGCLTCRQYFPYPSWISPRDRACPFCGELIPKPFPIVLQLYEKGQGSNYNFTKRRVVLGNGYKLFADIAEPQRKPPFSRRDEKPIGHVEWDQNNRQYRLINDDGGNWTARGSNGKFSVEKGESLPLVNGYYVSFGADQRLVVISE